MPDNLPMCCQNSPSTKPPPPLFHLAALALVYILPSSSVTCLLARTCYPQHHLCSPIMTLHRPGNNAKTDGPAGELIQT